MFKFQRQQNLFKTNKIKIVYKFNCTNSMNENYFNHAYQFLRNIKFDQRNKDSIKIGIYSVIKFIIN